MSPVEQNQAARVSDKAFAREMWRHAEQDNVEAAKDVRRLWKYGRESDGYGKREGALSAHEIDALAEQHLPGADGDVAGFARAVERSALIKAYTLLPELRQDEKGKGHRRYFRDGLAYGLALYSGAIRALAMGYAQGDVEPITILEPRQKRDLAQLERSIDAEPMRLKFEAWAGSRQFDLRRKDDSYTNMVTAYAWMGWLANDQMQAKRRGAGLDENCRSREKTQVTQ